MRRSIATALAAAMLATAIAVPAAADETPPTLGEQILADADGHFDYRFWDFDVIGEIVKAILESGIDTNLGASVEPGDLTVFLPNDLAFQRLAYDLTGVWYRNEADVIPAILGAVEATFGTTTFEETLGVVNLIVEYHVLPPVPGLGSITSDEALAADGAVLPTVMGATLEVYVKNPNRGRIVLIDNEPDLRDPSVIRRQVDNFASNGVWHGISRVLIPVDLP